MKRIITLLAALAIASAAHAQTDSLVVFDTQGDNLGISIAGFNITLGDDGSSSSGKTIVGSADILTVHADGTHTAEAH